MASERESPDPGRAPSRSSIESELAAAIPGLGRVAVASWGRSARWVVESALDTGTRTLRAAARGDSPAQILDEVTHGVREQLSTLTGIPAIGGMLRGVGLSVDRPKELPPATASLEELREKGAELLERSGYLGSDARTHPAYMRILEALAPDEARILHLFMREGSQPSVDIRTWGPFGLGSHLVEQGLTMVARQAGTRHRDRQAAYLSNLNRLGLVWFSHEPLSDQDRYMVLEAQPEVTEATERVPRARIVRRAIHLTDFGRDFCEVCLSSPAYEAGPGDGHSVAPEAATLTDEAD